MTFKKQLRCGLTLLLLATALPGLAREFELTDDGGDLIGEISLYRSGYQDTFIDIGRIHNVGYEELRIANPDVDPWLPGEGSVVTLPTEFILPATERKGLIVNVAEFRVYLYLEHAGQQVVATMPASVGRMDWATPVGLTGITAKKEKPSWYPPESVRQEYAEDGRELPNVVPPGPDNPLGDYALRLGLPGYLIHGTNRPAGVGMRVTHGCIRLFPEDIAWLFPQVEEGTPVRIVNQPIKFGWRGDALYLEVHPPLESGDEESAFSMTDVTREYVRATREMPARADWEQIASVFTARSGVPVRVGQKVTDGLARVD